MSKIKEKLWRKAKIGSYLLSFVPFIKEIAVNGSLANGNFNKNSDIDFFIITEKKRLWIVRFLSIIILDIFFLRAKNNKHQGKICLNHFLSSQNYALSPQDKYNAYQYSNLEIIYETSDTHNEFVAKNKWMEHYCRVNNNNYKKNKSNIIKLMLEFFIEGFADKLEKKIFDLQVKKIQNNPFFHLQGSRIKISDEEFYYYTNVDDKYKNFSYRNLDSQV